jgi:HEAT repeat protein
VLLPPLRPHFDAALRDASSRNARARALAAEALGDAPDERADEAKIALRTLADDTSRDVRAAALSSLGRLRDRGALELVLARFDDGDATVRQVAVMAAGEIGDPRAMHALRAALRDPRPELRFQAVASLATLAPDDAVSALAERVDDEDPEVRAHLADALGALERPEAAAPLARLLKDTVPAVRQGAAIGLARLGDARGVPELVQTLEDKDRCFEAAWALGELRAEAAREPLARIAQSFLRPLATKAAAAAALVRLDDPRGTEVLRAVLRAFRSDARSYAVQLVGELRLTALVDDVAALVDRPRGADPVVVAEALGKLAEQDGTARSALERLARQGSDAGRVAVEWLARRPA